LLKKNRRKKFTQIWNKFVQNCCLNGKKLSGKDGDEKQQREIEFKPKLDKSD
jgi:hypothetical protein